MSRFPTVAHMISWAGLCPKNDESAGKRRSTRMRKGAPWLKTTLVQCAVAAARKKSQLSSGAVSSRARPPRGKKLDRRGCCFDPDGGLSHAQERHPLARACPGQFDKRAQGKQVHRLINRMRDLGFDVQISPLEAAA
jgi:transposase